jgi:hypothetical protein
MSKYIIRTNNKIGWLSIHRDRKELTISEFLAQKRKAEYDAFEPLYKHAFPQDDRVTNFWVLFMRDKVVYKKSKVNVPAFVQDVTRHLLCPYHVDTVSPFLDAIHTVMDSKSESKLRFLVHDAMETFYQRKKSIVSMDNIDH